MKKSFVLYQDQGEIFAALTNEQAGKLVKAIFDYNQGKVPDLDATLTLVFISIKQTLKRDNKKWDSIIQRNIENGKKGGRPKIKNNPNKPKEPTGYSGNPKNLDSVNVSDNVNDINTISFQRKEIYKEKKDITSPTARSPFNQDEEDNKNRNEARRKLDAIRKQAILDKAFEEEARKRREKDMIAFTKQSGFTSVQILFFVIFLFFLTLLPLRHTSNHPTSIVLSYSVSSPQATDSAKIASQSTISPTVNPTSVPEKKLVVSEVSNKTEEAIINSKKHADIIWQIYTGESGRGKADICRQWGEYNGFGYNEYTGHHPTCFQSFEEVVSRVENWIESRIGEGYSLAELHCYYVTGKRTQSCNTSYQLVSN